MKNIIKAFLVIAMVAASSSAFAASFNDTQSTVIGGGLFKVSKGVTLTATATSSAYSAISGHTQGDKEFGTTSADPKIFTKTKTAGSAPTTANSATFDFSSWSAQ